MPVPSPRFTAGTTARLLLAATLLTGPAAPAVDEQAVLVAIDAISEVHTTGPSIGNAVDFGIDGVSPAVVRSGVTRTVQVTGHGLAEGVDIVLVSGGTYLESVTPLPESTLFAWSDMVVAGDRAYVQGMQSFHVLDVSDPARPIHLGWLPTPRLAAYGRMAVSGSRALVPAGYPFVTIDVSDPASPRRVDSDPSQPGCGPPYYIAVAGQTAYVSSNPGAHTFPAGHLCAFDLTADGAPVYLGHVEPFDNPWTSGGPLQAVGNLLYVADHERGLVALDVSDPHSVRFLSAAHEPDPDHGDPSINPGLMDLTVDGGFAYVNGWANNFLIYDVRDPLHVRRVSRNEIRLRRPGSLAVEADLAVFTHYIAPSPFLADASDPSRPTIDHWIPTWDWDLVYNTGLAITGDHVLSPGLLSMRSFNVEHRTRRDVIGRIPDAAAAVRAGSLVAASDPTDRTIRTYDISTPAAAILRGRVDLPEGITAWPLTMAGRDLIAVSPEDPRAGHLIDISDPAVPAYLGAIDTSGSIIANRCPAWGHRYSGSGIFGLPAIGGRSSSIGQYGLQGEGILIRWTDLTEGDDCAGMMEILRTDDPLRPSSAALLPGVYDAAGSRAVGLLGRRLTVLGCLAPDAPDGGCSRPQLMVWDLEHPTEPVLLSSLDPGGKVRDLDVDGDVVYLLVGLEGAETLRVLDVSNPREPRFRGSLSRGLQGATRVSGQGGHAHVQCSEELSFGFFQTLLVDVQDPDAPVIAGGASAIRGIRTGDVSLLDCYDDTCLFSLQPSQVAAGALDGSRFQIELPETLRSGPYHVVAFGENGQVDVLPNAVMVEQDSDGDGYFLPEDCDDGEASVHPGAPDLPGNAVDEDCDGEMSCDPGADWRHHGEFAACVARSCAELVAAGRVSGRECGRIVSAAAHSSTSVKTLEKR